MSRLDNNTDERNRQVKAHFVLQGSSLHAWCLANGVAPQNASKALSGKWRGPKATALIQKILEAAGVKE